MLKCLDCGRLTPAATAWERDGHKICPDCARALVVAATQPAPKEYTTASECPGFKGERCGCGNNGGGDCDYCSQVEFWTNHPEDVQGVTLEQFIKDCHAPIKFSLEPGTPGRGGPYPQQKKSLLVILDKDHEAQRGFIALLIFLAFLACVMAWASCQKVPQGAPLAPGQHPATYDARDEAGQ